VSAALLTCELCHGHGYEQTEDGKKECSACNSDGETLREHGRDEARGDEHD
jgi:DnaJ-class molecular chaperone